MLKVICNDSKLVPSLGTEGSGGYDLRLTNDVCIPRNERVKVGTGVKMQIPQGFVGMVIPRSSTGKKGLRLANTIGLIDSDYQGEIFLVIENIGTDTFLGYKYDTLFQIVIVPFLMSEILTVDSFESITTRGEGGFGSTDNGRRK